MWLVGVIYYLVYGETMERTQKELAATIPLAAQLRPANLAEVVGHRQLLGSNSVLRRAIEQGVAGSLILWGPPGVGKTTLAYLIADAIQATTHRVSAATAGVKDLRAVIAQAQVAQQVNQRTVLIVDEIHRFTKSQQDVLLPVVEEGLLTLIGATTENPYFAVVKALLSRAQVVRLEALTDEDVTEIVARAAGTLGVTLAADAMDQVVTIAGGDARRALTILERAVAGSASSTITVAIIESAGQQAGIHYDKAGDVHYDTISAFIKSMRGSDPDATLFYLFRMVVAGEDPRFIIRRMFIFASEDIGNADPHALMLVAAASQALEWVGLPEAEYALAHTAVYLAAAPKSNSIAVAIQAAKADVARHGNDQPPDHIVNAPIEAMGQHGRGVGYQYPHNFPSHVVQQTYRPAATQNNIYYEPGTEGFEKEVKRRVDQARTILRSTTS